LISHIPGRFSTIRATREVIEDKIMKYNRLGFNHEGLWASLMAQKVKNLPAVQETWV